MSINPLGLVLPAAALGFGSLLIRPVRRGFLPNGGTLIVPQATVEENHVDDVQITEHPIENGAAISDHAYKLPSEVTIKAGWSNSPSTAAGGSAGDLISKAVAIGTTIAGGAAPIIGAIAPTLAAAQSLLFGNDQGQVNQIYKQFLDLQDQRVLFDILTAKRSYKNMLIKTLSTMTDRQNENSMILTVVCKQIIIVSVTITSTSSDPSAQANPAQTSTVQDLGAKSLLSGANQIPNTLSLSGALGSVTAGIANMQNVLSSVSQSVLDSVGGAIKGLPAVLTGVQTALVSTIGKVGPGFEIPTVGSTLQTFSLDLDTGGLTSDLKESLQNLEPTMLSARTAIINMGQQLPSVSGSFTTEVANSLKVQALAVPTQINTALKQINNVFQRNQ